jgi:hypothetical protein
MTYFYNWRTPTPTLLGDFRSPVGNPWIGTYEFWVGPLPSAVGDKPFINVEPTTGLTFFVPKSGNPANQTATITNSNPNIKLGTLSTAISPSTVTWLTVTPSGTGETRTLTHMIDGTKVTDGTTIAKVTVSGSNAANTVEYTVTVNKGDGPPAPSNLGASVTGDSLLDVALSWTDNSSNEAGFIIDRRRDEQSSWTEIKRVSANVKTYTDLHIPTGTYFYRVRAYTSTMQSMYSNEVRADVLGIQWIRISRPFSGLTVKPGAIDTIFWTANRVGQVRILLTTNNGATWEQINGITSISTSSPTWGKYPWKVPNVISDEVMIQVIEYQEKVEATTEPFSISNTNSAVIPGQGRLLNHSWIITNSSNGDILVRGTNTGTSSNIVISRLNGTTVYTSKISKGNTLVIPQSRLAKGTYIVHIESGNSVTVKRLITPALER